MVHTILDRVALWVGRVVLDGVAVSLLMCVVVVALEIRDNRCARKFAALQREWENGRRGPAGAPYERSHRGFTVIRRRAR